MLERRRFIRFDLNEKILLKPAESASAVNGSSIDLSYLGIGVNSTKRLEAGSDLEFNLMTKLWGKPVIGCGRIIHVQEEKKQNKSSFRMGIEFTDIDKNAVRCILNRLQEDICSRTRANYFKL